MCDSVAARSVRLGSIIGGNVAAAACAAWLAGAEPEGFAGVLKSFQRLPASSAVCGQRGRFAVLGRLDRAQHRNLLLQHCVSFFRSEPIVLAGGYDKGQDLSELSTAICGACCRCGAAGADGRSSCGVRLSR
ncbi:MAG UNVERIFIED_CONTAM: hypothetical protein LVR18_46405 [Planctomycetaceae bacterium]